MLSKWFKIVPNRTPTPHETTYCVYQQFLLRILLGTQRLVGSKHKRMPRLSRSLGRGICEHHSMGRFQPSCCLLPSSQAGQVHKLPSALHNASSIPTEPTFAYTLQRNHALLMGSGHLWLLEGGLGGLVRKSSTFTP